MTLSSIKAIHDQADERLLTPWAATGTLGRQEARLFAEAAASDPVLKADLATARAEQTAVCELAEALGRPSLRPMLALFAAIDRAAQPLASNVTRLDTARALRPPGDAHTRVGSEIRKICRGC